MATAAASTIGDRATTVNNIEGNIGRFNTEINDRKSNDREGREEKKAIVSISVAREWSEGKPTPVTSIAGESSAIMVGEDKRGTEIRVGELGVTAAKIRVGRKGGRLGLNTPKSSKFSFHPPNSFKSHSKPHSQHINQIPPVVPKIPRMTQKNSKTLFFTPIYPCQNSFKALAYSTSTKVGEKEKQRIFYCGTTDTISFDPLDFLNMSDPPKSYVQTASGDLAWVEGTGTINISLTLRLSNCLFVPTLSHKLLSVSHVTKELNCKLLMQPRFCMLQDINTGTIVGRDTERRGLYYVDEIAQQSTTLLTNGPNDRQTWLLHRRLGHPSIG